MITLRKAKARALSAPGLIGSQYFAFFSRAVFLGSIIISSVPFLIWLIRRLHICPSSLVPVILLPHRSTSLFFCANRPRDRNRMYAVRLSLWVRDRRLV